MLGGGKMKGGETMGGGSSSISPLVSFVLGAAMATVCILFVMSASPGRRLADISAWSNADDAPPLPLPLQEVAADSNDSLAAAAAAAANVTVVAAPAPAPVEAPAPASPYGDLEEVLRRAATKDRTVIMTQINLAWTKPGSLLDLFFESFRLGEGGVSRLLDHLVIVTMDPAAYEGCQAVHRHCYFLRTTGVDYRSEKMFMSKDYLEMMWGRNKFQQTILELGYNFLFTDVDVMWFRDPFRHISMGADIAISSDVFIGDPYSLGNFPNGGFLFVRSNNKTIDFYRSWQQGRWRFFGKHEQDVFNLIKHEQQARLGIAIQFLDTTYISGFCQLSKDLNKICTLHANCCVGLGAKMHDLRGVLDVWRNYTAAPPDERRSGKFQWKLPGICIH
uniref:Nucleotide-diphospho-sugar transferase domain-containing protein n=1 Tax=Oryza punctata TaxID=4537 RepID=A0A0E0KLK0_ORYPU